MINYTHECRDCLHIWEEEYSIHDDPPDRCPDCGSAAVFRHVGSAGFVLKGSGWASDGYYHFKAYDRQKEKGLNVKRYEKKEDLDREMRGEAMEREKQKLKRLNEVSKKTIGGAVTQEEADKKIQKAGEDAVSLPSTD